jgi:hypothetical protein
MSSTILSTMPASMRLIGSAAVSIATLACVLDCGSNCPGLSSPAFEITVMDVNSAVLCNATVTATGPETVALAMVPEADGGCVFEDNGTVKGGAYGITASAPGHKSTQSPTLNVMQDACGHDTETQQLTMVLGF